MRRPRIHPLGIIIIVIWCAMAVISQTIIAAQDENEDEQESKPNPDSAPDEAPADGGGAPAEEGEAPAEEAGEAS